MRAGSKHLIREINQSLVLDAVRREGSISRTDIAALTGLSAPTVSGIASELIDRGLLFEASTGQSAGGRKPILLELNAGAGFVIGAKVTEHEAIGVLTDLNAGVVARGRTRLSGQASHEVIDAMERLVQRLAKRAAGRPVHGIGVGLAGVVDRRVGIVRHATYFEWRNVMLAEELAVGTGFPVVIDNDINALVANELWFRHGRDVDDLLVISLGRGIGLGMVLEGRIHRGALGGAGEFGHVTVEPDGPPCACGKRGCLEAVVADPALLRRLDAVGAGRDGLPAALDRAAAAPEGPERAVFASAARTLGRAIADLVNVLNPERIVLTGEGVRLAEVAGDELRAGLAEHVFDGLADELELVVQPWEDEDWARGAAAVLLGELFQPSLRRADDDRVSFAR